MSEDDQNSKEIVTSYDEILEITGLLAMRDNSMSCVTEKKETPNSTDNINNGDVSNDDIVLPIQSCTQLPLSPSLVSLVEDGGPNCRTISIAKTKNNNVGFTFTEIKQGLFVSHVDERSSAKLNKVRFGDKIQCINDIEVTSYTQAKQLIEETHPTVNFSFLDCPYREVKTIYKIHGKCGLFINDGMILDRTKYFSTKSDKIPLNYYITEIDGHSTVRLLDEKIVLLVERANSPFSLHIVPQWFYEYLVFGLDPSGNELKKGKRTLFSCFHKS
ncbi:unnamed protein product [Schistosoma mattheei]|uniref:PDZ domain-containing protein n=2 Tax=Schistosoma mattheei TaxID=31246 RepID=A0AA85AQA2_9TREM|nr:unnamed protein product [Schistosoma mattheei]